MYRRILVLSVLLFLFACGQVPDEIVKLDAIKEVTKKVSTPVQLKQEIKWVNKDSRECAKKRIDCEPGYRPFSSQQGCGCKLTGEPTQKACTQEDRDIDFCTQVYSDVCGWSAEDIKCVTYPCAQTYVSGCKACQEETVAYWTEGACPKARTAPSNALIEVNSK